MTSRTGSGGFTLVEVLVATVILFAGLGAVLQAYSMAVVALDAADMSLAATDLLSERATLLELTADATAGGATALPTRSLRDGSDYLFDGTVTRTAPMPGMALDKATLGVVRVPAGIPRQLQTAWVVFEKQEVGRVGTP